MISNNSYIAKAQKNFRAGSRDGIRRIVKHFKLKFKLD